jgi:hypothetical protein
MVMPCDQGGEIRYDAFERNIEKYIDSGLQGFLVLGAAGHGVDAVLVKNPSSFKRVTFDVYLVQIFRRMNSGFAKVS